jgi:hypothetical protein
MGKKFLPVRVQNPTSLQHVVRLKPRQPFNLILDHDLYDNHLVEASGDYLEVETLEHKDKSSEYRITQKEDLSEWSKYASHLLGEVWVDSKSSLAKLVVMLECTNAGKQDHVALINPFFCDVRVRPYHVVEIILFNQEYIGYHDKWTCLWIPKLDGLQMEQIGYDSMGLYHGDLLEFVDYDPPDYFYAKFPRAEAEKFARQHHFWYRFDESVLALLAENHGVLHAGEFEIQGHDPAKPIRFRAGVYLDARKKYQRKMLKTLNTKPKDEYSVYTYRQNQPTSIVHVPKKQKPILPMVRDVAITPFEADALDEGCKVLSPVLKDDPDLTDYDDLMGLGRWAKGKYGGIYHKVRRPWD